MRTWRAKCITGFLASGVAALAVAPSAMAGTNVQVVSHAFAAPPTTAQCEQALGIACYNASQFEVAYGLTDLYRQGITGAGQTIVIVDAFGSPTIRHDLAEYDTQNGLPAPPSFNIITPEGAPPPYDGDNAVMGNWAIETSLDVEQAHAMAPGANILLVETPVAETVGIDGFPQIENAIKYVVDHHLGNVVSQSFAAAEQTFAGGAAQIKSLEYAYKDAASKGVTVLGASGDQGVTSAMANGDYFERPVVNWPASDPYVTGVGGTQLHLDQNGATLAPANVWNDSAMFGSAVAGGGGLSSIFSRPAYQNSVANVVGDHRGVPDISASAAVNGASNIYISAISGPNGITAPGWYLIGGTSEASPLTAGIISLADQVAGHGLGLINPALYQMGMNGAGAGLSDVTLGNNGVTWVNSLGVTHTLPGFQAGPGYDLASGLGQPHGAAFVLNLAANG